MPHERESSSYRDPSGHVFRQHGVLYRQVNHSYQPAYDHLMSSGLYAELCTLGLLIPHEEVKMAVAKPVYKILQPMLLQFISYPYEWAFSQLKDVALATLTIQEKALAYGMSLKDASAYNIQFDQGKPILIDTLSFELYEERPWVAYQQFCQHFLAPLALMSAVDIRLQQLLRPYMDGIPLDLASRLLPISSRLRPAWLLHIHAHAKSQARHGNDGRGGVKIEKHMPKNSLLGMLESLRSGIEQCQWKPAQTEWADYYESNNNYLDIAKQDKLRIVCEMLKESAPKSVWDLGGNTGEFSRIASNMRIPTVCWDIDPSAVEINYRESRKLRDSFHMPLLVDLTNPPPRLGWALSERMSIFDRGPVDTVMVLALVHHLAISHNLPFTYLASLFADICANALIIEFVPKSDSQVQILLSTREDIFPDYNEGSFEAAFAAKFQLRRKCPVDGSDRVIYLFVKR